MQGFLAIFTFFVDYAHFYVNMIMSTNITTGMQKYSNPVHIQRCWVTPIMRPLNIVFARGIAKTCKRVNITYLLVKFVQITDMPFYVFS